MQALTAVGSRVASGVFAFSVNSEMQSDAASMGALASSGRRRDAASWPNTSRRSSSSTHFRSHACKLRPRSSLTPK
jgi:hypothetical protein